MNNPARILIIGMGPCGLGAAWRLQEMGHTNFRIFEKSSKPGGLASSHRDEKGFTWDTGGHVQFSHYPYYDRVLDQVMKDDWLYHERSSWIWLKNRFVPYPFQNNIRYLDEPDLWNCLGGLLESLRRNSEPLNFQDWIFVKFGKGIADIFMIPYNRKVWAFSLDKLSYTWINERVATPDLKRIVENVFLKKDDLGWGPNNKFRFPVRGATGEIWRRVSGTLDPARMAYGYELQTLDTRNKTVYFKNGQSEKYDFLISSIPLDVLIRKSDLNKDSLAEQFIHSSTHIIGVGLEGKPTETLRHKSWMYFPEPEIPFYRVTVFSNYSPNNVPDPSRYWSLMAEISESPEKKVDSDRVIEAVVEGMRSARLIDGEQKIVDLWHHYEPYGYPTPFLQRDNVLKEAVVLEERSVFSRGRFGAWKYEASNQDHSFMQGVEVVNRILLNEKETVISTD